MKALLIFFILFFFISCGNSPTGTEAPAKDFQGNSKEDNPDMQIRGIGLKNNGSDSVIVFENNNKEQLLYPGESCDYLIFNSPSIIMVVGQNDQWIVEKQKRYQLVMDSNGIWLMEEVP